MSSKRWIGGATAVAQVDRFTPANVEVADIFTLTATGEDGSTAAVTFTAAATTVASVTAGLVAAWNASSNPLCTGITASDATTSLTLTSDVAGVPFSVASSTTDGGGSNTQTLVRAAVTANAGPNDWATAVNWSDYTVPVSTDTVTIDARSQYAISCSLNQSAVTLTRLIFMQGCPQSGTEAAYLRISVTTLDINVPPVDGSRASPTSGIYIDTGTNATTTTCYGSATQGLDGLESVIWKGVHASNILRVRGGRVGIATLKPGDVATLPTLQVLQENAGTHVGSGVTLTALTVTDKTDTLLECACATINQDGGGSSIRTEGTGAITTVYAGGQFISNSTGTVTTLTVENEGNLVLDQSTAARTISACSVSGPRAKISARLPVTSGSAFPVTFSAGIDCINGATSAQVDLGGDITITPSAV